MFWMGVSRKATAANFLAVALVLGGVAVQAKPRIMKADPKGRAGTCTGPLNATPGEILRRNGISTRSATNGQTEALAKGILQIERLAGGNFSAIRGTTFNFLNSRRGSSNQAGTTINMRGGPAKTANTAYVMHELGHRVGNNGYYAKYRSAVKTPCLATHYCSKSYSRARYRNEEFAEVFAAFVTNPDHLKNAGPSCRAAYDFFAKQVFKNGNLADCGVMRREVLAGRDPLGAGRGVASVPMPRSRPATPEVLPGPTACRVLPSTINLLQLAALEDALSDDVHAANH